MTSNRGAGVVRLFALVPCAGAGSRSGAAGPKQYVAIAGRTLVAHTLGALSRVRRLAQTLVVLAPGDTAFAAAAPGFEGWVAACGGASRAATVRAGLDELLRRGAGPNDWVLVHDAARCLIEAEWVDRLIDACLDDAVGGLLALPLADTLKSAAGDRVQSTVDRRDKWAAQTPQMFRLGQLREALIAAGDAVTDESSAMEALGLAPRLVRGSAHNLKVTLPEDFALAQALMEARRK